MCRLVNREKATAFYGTLRDLCYVSLWVIEAARGKQQFFFQFRQRRHADKLQLLDFTASLFFFLMQKHLPF